MTPSRANDYAALLASLQADASWARRFVGYMEFVRLMAAGDRNTAIHKAARPFVAEAQKWPVSDRWEFVNGLCQKIDHRGRPARSTPYIGFTVEVAEELAIPTLLEALTLDPKNALAHLWLAIIPSRKATHGWNESAEHFKAAHNLAPRDPLITERYVDWLIYSIEWDTHELPAGLLNDKESVLSDLDEVESLLDLLPSDFRAIASSKASTYRAKLAAYRPNVKAANDAP